VKWREVRVGGRVIEREYGRGKSNYDARGYGKRQHEKFARLCVKSMARRELNLQNSKEPGQLAMWVVTRTNLKDQRRLHEKGGGESDRDRDNERE